MYNRTRLADKAVRSAWEKEQELVREGKGTRDWTPEQQKDILERGRAYDVNGKTFEGHHMMSVEAHPEYQAEAGNIQLLSREEHFNAHNGNFQNPTCGYFNPLTSETDTFLNGVFTPCEVLRLTTPYALNSSENSIASESKDESETKSENPGRVSKEEQVDPPTSSDGNINAEIPISEPIPDPMPKKCFIKRVLKRMGSPFIDIGRWIAKNPGEAIAIASAVAAVGKAVSDGLSQVHSGGSSTSDSSEYYRASYSESDYSDYDYCSSCDTDSSDDDSEGEDSKDEEESTHNGKGTSKSPHERSGFERHLKSGKTTMVKPTIVHKDQYNKES